jgi:hypothetical protein
VPWEQPRRPSRRWPGKTTKEQERSSTREEDPRLHTPLQELLVRQGAEYEKHKNVDRRFAMCDFNPFFVYVHNTIPALRFSALLSVGEVTQAEVALV